MYGRGNYGHQFGQVPNTPMPPAYPQRPITPPPPPPHFQPGHSAAASPLNKNASSAVRPHVGHPGPHIYHQHGPTAPHPINHQGPSIQVPSCGMLNTGQSYLQVHGNVPLPLPYPNAQQNLRHPSHIGMQNVHHIPPPVPPPPLGPPCSEMLPAPPPLPQGQTLYRVPVQPRLQHPGAVQGLQHITPPPPPPPTYSFSGPAQIENAISSGKSQTPSMVPPPPPSSPPPVPPCPPPFTSSLTSSSTPTQVRHNASVNASNLSQGGGSGSEVGPAAVNGTTDGSAILDLPPPPPKPREEKVVQAIEDLCQLITKNGPSVEDMTYRDEAKNPKFSFLYGGEPGSEAETAHDYFLWMKKKCILAYKMHEGQSLSSLRPLKSEPSMQSDHLIVEAGCNSPSDSDMEMEDDFTQSDKDQGVNHSFEGVNNDCDWIAKKLDPNEQLHVRQSSAEGSSTKDILSEKVPCSGFSELGEQGLHHDNPKLGSSTSEVHSAVLISAGDSEHPFSSNLEKSSTLLSNDLSLSSKASAAAEAISSDKPFGELAKGGTPFTLIQGYASDDSSENDDKPCREDGSPLTLSLLVTAGAINSHKDAGCDLGKNVESKDSYRTEPGDRLLREYSMPCKAPEISSFSQKEVKDIGVALISSGTTGEHFDYNHVNQASISHASPHDAVWEEDDMVSARTDVSNSAMSPKKNKEKEAQHESSPLKVDEFGRLVKEDATDTDTDDSHYTRRHNKRARSRSHSGSPLDRRRRSRRSPRKRRERRSRSRSWSPRNPRSRSRSPLSRRAGEFSLENRRRDKGQRPECFDFLRGRCYRGASCRYMHHESDRSSESRHQKGKQMYPDVPPSARTSKIREEVHNLSRKVSNHEFEASKSQEMQPYRDVLGTRKDGNISRGSYDTYRDAGQSGISNSDGQVFTSDLINYDSSQEVAVKVREMQVVQEKPEQPTVDPHNDENRRETVDSHQPLSVDGFLSQSVDDVNALKTKGLQNAYCSSRLIYDSPISGPSPNRTSTTSPNKFSTSEPFPNVKSSQPWLSIGQLSSERFSVQSLASKESSHGISAMGFSHHPSALHPPPGSQGVNAVHMPEGPKDHNLTPQSAHLPFESASGESFHSRQGPFPKQPSRYSVTPNSSLTSLPPPPPQPLYDSTSDVGTATKGVSLQLQESHLLACQNSTRLYHGNKPTYPRVGKFPCEAYPPGLERHQHLSYVEDLGANPMPKINQSSPPFGGTSLLRENRFSHLPVQDLVSSSSFASGNIHSQPMPSSQELFMNETRPSSGDDLPPGELTKSSSQSHHYSEQQHPAYGLYSASTYPPGLPDGDQSSRLLDFGGSRISAHCNPYASTFERPLSSKYSSDAFNQEKDSSNSNKHDSSFNVSHVSVDGLGVGNVRSRQTTSSPSSTKPVGQILPRSGGDQYDPLFDSIEPSSNSIRRDDYGQNPELSGESDTILGLSGTCKRLDAAEKHKDVGTVASTTSLDNDEYGETADAEVGAVENESPIKVVNMTAGDIEIDQIKSSRKSKKSKDSRSMKLFKIAVADFVKEVLKPSWRQGNMSKEAFKTIVKKTVDKVSGAMKNHHVPKSQAKIDQYIDSSQRKLTKLVMGYVDKYVKV